MSCGLFGIGMVLYGYCPGTALGAVGTESPHALAGVFGMIAGAIVYAYSFEWVRTHILPVWKLGKITRGDVTGVPVLVIYVVLAALALVSFAFLERPGRRISASSGR